MGMREGKYCTTDVILAFARQGIALATISRAILRPIDQIERLCQAACESGELARVPVRAPNTPESPDRSELLNLRFQLDDAHARIRELLREQTIEEFHGFFGLTSKEAVIVGLLVRTVASRV
jgi:hypothetical protein